MNNLFVIMRDGYFLMKGADISFKNINWAGHRNLAQTFNIVEANNMKEKFNMYTEVKIVSWKDTFIFGELK